jgi:hypothetical protein
VLGSNACLTELKIEGFLNGKKVTAIATALTNDVASSVLESLMISACTNLSQTQVLVGCLPKMKHLRKLNITVQKGVKVMLLQALQRNWSLWHVAVTDYSADWLEVDTAKIEVYAKRNKHIHAILEGPEDKVQEPQLTTWPRFFRAVKGCEMEASFVMTAVMALSGSLGPRDPERSE